MSATISMMGIDLWVAGLDRGGARSTCQGLGPGDCDKARSPGFAA